MQETKPDHPMKLPLANLPLDENKGLTLNQLGAAQPTERINFINRLRNLFKSLVELAGGAYYDGDYVLNINFIC